MNYNKPQITLVGAGPGDRELITIKGVKALQQANVILYDALVDISLLDYAQRKAIKIYVGKRANKHAYTQSEINQLLVDYAFQYGNVVRLKGGDPFVFGRGNEEIEFAQRFGIETQYIPGISSSIAVPGLQGIPVTQRNVSEGFWVITGTKSDGSLAEDIYRAAQSNSTVVILMGVSQLPKIVAAYKNAGRNELPIAIIQNGSLPSENVAIGTIESIEEQAWLKKIGAPAIIIIGETVAQHHNFKTFIGIKEAEYALINA